LHTSIAKGGPLDSVKLSGPPEWNGLIRHTNDSSYVYYHQGRYSWVDDAWVWSPEKIGRAPFRAAPKPRSKQAHQSD
jgi:hypothetical protein